MLNNVQAVVGSFAQPTATGNYTFSPAFKGAAFKGKLILFWVNNKTADGSAADSQIGFGAASSASQRWYSSASGRDNQASHIPNRAYSTAKCLGLVSASAASVVMEADFVTFNQDGSVTLNFTTADATARIINYMILGGGGITNVFVGNDTAPATAIAKSFTGPGFKPDAIITHVIDSITAPPSVVQNNARPAVGFGSAAASAHNSSVFSTAAVTSFSYQRSNGVIGALSAAGAVETEASLQSMDPTGWTGNFTSVVANVIFFYIAIQGVSIQVGAVNQPTSNGLVTIGSLPFNPVAILVSTFAKVAATAAQNTMRFGMGAATGPSSRFALNIVGSNAGTTQDDQDLDRTKILKMMTQAASGAPTTQAAADVQSVDATQVVLNFTSTDATAREFIYMIFGETGSLPNNYNFVQVGDGMSTSEKIR